MSPFPIFFVKKEKSEYFFLITSTTDKFTFFNAAKSGSIVEPETPAS